MNPCRVLVIDDEPNLLLVVSEKLRREGFEVSAFSDAESAIERIVLSQVDVVLTDLTMPGSGGIEVLEYCRSERPDLPVIIMTAYGSIEKAVEAMRKGAFDFITKPFEPSALVELLRRAASAAKARDLEPRAVARIGEAGSPMLEVLREIDKLAPLSAPVCILGEHGTGKESVARELHRLSPRSAGPFVRIHCGALSRERFEAELFGEEGSRPGKIELAQGGTLLLEGVLEMPAASQDRLLRLVREGTFERKGGFGTLHSDARLVVASEERLGRRGSRIKGELADLLSVASLKIPPLRERRMDLRRLSLFYFRQATARANRIVSGMSEELMAWLESQEWPGNLRQLENTLESLVALCTGAEVGLREATQLGGAIPFKEQVRLHTQQLEKSLIEAELVRQQGNVSRTAEALGLSRKGLQLKLKELGIRTQAKPSF